MYFSSIAESLHGSKEPSTSGSSTRSRPSSGSMKFNSENDYDEDDSAATGNNIDPMQIHVQTSMAG
jgi:hypothetical protein